MRDTAENSRLPCRPSKAVQFRASKDSRKGGEGEDFSVFKELSCVYVCMCVYARAGACVRGWNAETRPFKAPHAISQLRTLVAPLCRYFRVRVYIYQVSRYLYKSPDVSRETESPEKFPLRIQNKLIRRLAPSRLRGASQFRETGLHERIRSSHGDKRPVRKGGNCEFAGVKTLIVILRNRLGGPNGDIAVRVITWWSLR